MCAHDSACLSAGSWYLNSLVLSQAVAMGDDLRKPGVLPVSHGDGMTLITCEGEGRERQSLHQEAAMAGSHGKLQTWENEELVPIWRQQKSRYAQETRLSRSHFPCPRPATNHPPPSSVLWEHAVQ